VKARVSPTDFVALAGVTAMLTIWGAPTVSVATPAIVEEVAVIVATPTPELVASPFEPVVLLTTATVASDVDHVTVVVMSFVVWSV
jgi:hypothetical protein